MNTLTRNDLEPLLEEARRSQPPLAADRAAVLRLATGIDVSEEIPRLALQTLDSVLGRVVNGLDRVSADRQLDPCLVEACMYLVRGALFGAWLTALLAEKEAENA